MLFLLYVKSEYICLSSAKHQGLPMFLLRFMRENIFPKPRKVKTNYVKT